MKDIFALKLHEEIEIGDSTFVMKVPNGFLYTTIWYKNNILADESDPFGITSEREEFAVTQTFVPDFKSRSVV